MGNRQSSTPVRDGSVKEKDMLVDKNKLDAKERTLLRKHWPLLMKENPQLFNEVWAKAVERSLMIKRTFELQEGDSLENNPSFMRLIAAVEAFFHRLIVTHDLDHKSIQETCVALGSKHVQYSQRGFQAIYWDIFMLCLTDSVENKIIVSRMGGKHQLELMSAWQKLIRTVVESMRRGYREEQQEERANSPHPSRNLQEDTSIDAQE